MQRKYEQFKEFILNKYHGYNWHTLSNKELLISLKEYNITAKVKLNKFWD